MLIDSVQSQANRLEEALLGAAAEGAIDLPFVAVDFQGAGLEPLEQVTSLDAPHRVYDAIIRDSLLDGAPFMKSGPGKRPATATPADATALPELSPTALVFGAGSGVRVRPEWEAAPRSPPDWRPPTRTARSYRWVPDTLPQADRPAARQVLSLVVAGAGVPLGSARGRALCPARHRPHGPETKETTQHGANRLAAVGLAALTVVPERRSGKVRLGMLGGERDAGGAFSFTWPIWWKPIGLPAICNSC